MISCFRNMKASLLLVGLLALIHGSQQLNSDVVSVINVKIWVTEVCKHFLLYKPSQISTRVYKNIHLIEPI